MKRNKVCHRCGNEYVFEKTGRGVNTRMTGTGGYKFCNDCLNAACVVCGNKMNHQGRTLRRVSVCFECLYPGKTPPGPRLSNKNPQALKIDRRLRKLWNKQKRLCYWCGINPWQQPDHVVPKSRGGSDLEGNLVPSCKRCNALKGNFLVSELRHRMPRWGR